MRDVIEWRMSARACIVWFRTDLRTADNPALAAAAARGGPVVPVYIWSPEEEGRWPPGAAMRWWLHQSLAALNDELERLGSPLVIRRGPVKGALIETARETGADAIFWNRRYEPAISKRDREIEAALEKESIAHETFNAALLTEPWEISTQQGQPYRVFTPYWRMHEETLPPLHLASTPRKLTPPGKRPQSLALDSLELEPKIDWTTGMREFWKPGEAGARELLRRFIEHEISVYPNERNRPATDGTSRLSPYLAVGAIGPRQIRAAIGDALGGSSKKALIGGANAYTRELAWRDFAYHQLYHFPYVPDESLRPEFKRFPWDTSKRALKAWQRGRTGYPIVDAGMRQLWRLGWMHNRVRMIVASFLIKDLLIDWREGARWFWDTLIDADLANNTLNWQWVAGSGFDAAPYFRIFNPVLQGEKFDPQGDYVRQWVDELAHGEGKAVHQPWEMIDAFPDYPERIVDHTEARARALKAFETMKK